MPCRIQALNVATLTPKYLAAHSRPIRRGVIIGISVLSHLLEYLLGDRRYIRLMQLKNASLRLCRIGTRFLLAGPFFLARKTVSITRLPCLLLKEDNYFTVA